MMSKGIKVSQEQDLQQHAEVQTGDVEQDVLIPSTPESIVREDGEPEGSLQPESEHMTDDKQVTVVSGKRRIKLRTKLVNADDVMPKPSFWPLGLALAIAIILYGILSTPIIIGVGFVLVVVMTVGWVLERR
ncbi:MAG TPA: hypothetical protein VL461_06040 [Dictyobacter sp.]|jgi:hypothetical protein|nr:hypothetical protein [Dictyobacter sp.]